MTDFTPAVEAVMRLAKHEATKKNAGLVEPEHFVWAVYTASSEVQPQAVKWMESNGVQSERVRTMLMKDHASGQSCSEEGAEAKISSGFQRILNVAKALTPTQRLTTEAVICSILMHGKSKATDILEVCSNGRVRPFDMQPPFTLIGGASSRGNNNNNNNANEPMLPVDHHEHNNLTAESKTKEPADDDDDESSMAALQVQVQMQMIQIQGSLPPHVNSPLSTSPPTGAHMRSGPQMMTKATMMPTPIVGPMDPKVLPRYGGEATFARLPRINEVRSFDVAVLGLPYDSGCTYRPGARFGPSAVRQASRILRGYNPMLDVNAFYDQQVVDAGDVCCNPFNVQETMDSVTAAALEIMQCPALSDGNNHARILAIGGDHSISYPLLRAHRDVYGSVALVHFDAHLDTWDTYFGERHTHGTPFRRAAEEGLFRSDASIHVGIRGPVYDAADLEADAELGFKIIRADDVETLGISGVVKRIRDRVGTLPVYLSIDIDVLDPAFAPGTGTPEAGGFTSRELLNILRGLKGLFVVGADVMEVSPAYDHAEITAMAASSVSFELMSLMAYSRKSMRC